MRLLYSICLCLAGLLAAGELGLTLRAQEPEAERGDDAVYRGQGLCQFRLHEYKLPAATEASINKVLGDSLEQHRAAFGFALAPEFRMRIRIFGKFEGFELFTRTNRHLKDLVLHSQSLSNLNGYYSGANREIVTWRQRQPSYLANNLLHEASHAILDAHYRRIPTWLSEGCATYFAFPQKLQDAHDMGIIRYRWAALNLWLREKRLPEPPAFLNLTHAEWNKVEPNVAYTVSWSLFQHLMSTPAKRKILQQLMERLQDGPERMDSSAALEALYPGGLTRFTRDWHLWISGTGAKLFGADLEEYMKQVR